MIQSNMCWLVRLLPTCFEYDKIVAMKQLIHREVKLRLPLCNMVVRDYASKSGTDQYLCLVMIKR